MARALTGPQRTLLRADSIACNLLATFFLDEGTYRFCDDVRNLVSGSNTFLGANALVESVEVGSGRDLAAESVTLVCDGTRMEEAGIPDPATVLRDILTYLHHQRRVDLQLGFRYPTEVNINLAVPIYAGKINSARYVEESDAPSDSARVTTKLIIELDSLAARYNRATHRTRSHADQLELDATDQFFSFTADAALNERRLFWGKAAPLGSGTRVVGAGGTAPGVDLLPRHQF